MTANASPPAPGPSPAATAFDELHTQHATALTRQAYLLTGQPRLARRAVERGFHLAWQRWPEVAVAPDPAGWVRAAVYEQALRPWHRLVPGGRTSTRMEQEEPSDDADRALREAIAALPAPYRRVLLLHDGLGLGLYATAAEVEASTRAAAGRLTHARDLLAADLPELGLAGQPPARQGAILRDRLAALLTGPADDGPATGEPPPTGAQVRDGSERGARRTTRAAFGLTGLFALVTLSVAVAAPDHYATPPQPPEAKAPATRHPGPATDRAVHRTPTDQARLLPEVR
ncbi:sigma factor-like helix-turn-helix DNA-binding protein [Streptomyces sp. NPDC059649]|uniref:sigma factor-like helix-turn-helix DNA-binding protein n=1 Tax=Streptomyces sp. NPDC059649 TaxID=3346895 RepID=UPI0036B1B6EB